MTDKVVELKALVDQETPAAWISNLWDKLNQQRQTKIEEWIELRNYVFATDTSTTSNSTLPWKNSTTLPKLCQIRDNLHSNYLSALFPNDQWARWEGYSMEDSLKAKRKAIEAYMMNKTRQSNFRVDMSKLLYDYIDYGNAFATVVFENKKKVLPSGEEITDYVGPRAVRISPLDIVFDPTANSFAESFKIVRSIKTMGEVIKMAKDMPESASVASSMRRRATIVQNRGGYSTEDFKKAVAYSVDGFGNLFEYYQSNYVEILEFYGDYFNYETGELQEDRLITVIDRATVIRNESIPSWFGSAPIYHAGWRLRPDNLWAMGPLDNLVGLQYRIDHLENLKADAMDLSIHPPLVIRGEVEEFKWGPSAEIHIDENGSVDELGMNFNGVITAQNEIAQLEDKMELYAGAPREAMGIRTPGEKTMYEVQQLQNAAGRIFQEKITSFEILMLEPLLNAMLESSVRNMNTSDVIRVMDDDVGVQDFLTITKEDITASGKLRPIGARHYAAQAQLMQNLNGIFQSQIGQIIAPHTSSIAMANMVSDIMCLDRYELFRPNVAVMEQQETQDLINQTQEDSAVSMSMPVEQPV